MKDFCEGHSQDCSRIRQQLSVALEGEGSENDLLGVQKHLIVCPSCRKHSQELQGLMHLLRKSKIPVSAELSGQLAARVGGKIGMAPRNGK